MILIVCFFVARVLAVIDPSLKHCDHNRTEVLECVNHYAGAGSRGMAEAAGCGLNAIRRIF